MQSWKLQTAKAQFSELLRCASQEGPQDITIRGRSVAVMMSRELFDRMSGNEQSLVDFMRASPLAGHDEIEFERP
ncbi:MAG: type II toxin-antitoxin system Phd/YefM family antitoxin [Betaproteobacteria bacterium]|nr:type II toxin-antitoxin system Phd/YefM family antitoxin [Betaproteobacteria bacterium]